MSLATPGPCDEGRVLARPSLHPRGQRDRAWILAATILASSMTFIDGTVVNVALPTLQVQLGASVAQVQWIVESYALLLASLLLTGGALGDRFGRRRVFLIGVSSFGVASIACGLSHNVGELIAARAVQGAAAALLVPGSLAILSSSFADNERGAAIGTWSGFSAIAAGIGPVVGGLFIERLSWRWIFFMNVPLALAVLAITASHVPESRDDEAVEPLDVAGAILATLGLGGIVFGLVEWNARTRSPLVVGIGLGVGLAAFLGFLLLESRSRAPMMPLEMFRSRTFAGANLLTFLLYAGLGGLLFFLPLNLIQVQGYSATTTGAALLPFVLLMFLLSRAAGGLLDRVGPKLPLIVGPAITAVGFALFALPGPDSRNYWTSFFPAIIVMSLGMATSVAPLTTTVLGAAERHRAGVASGINNAVSRTAGLLAVAAFGVVLLHVFETNLDLSLERLPVSPELRTSVRDRATDLAAIQIPSFANPAERVALERAVSEAFVRGFRCVALVAAALAALGALAAAWLVEGRSSSSTRR